MTMLALDGIPAIWVEMSLRTEPETERSVRFAESAVAMRWG